MPFQRIISLVPSQTELLFDLGLDDQLVGVTKFCIHPGDKVGRKVVIGGTKTLHLDRIHALQPDLIIANKEENTREQIEALQQHYRVHVTDIKSLPDALAMIRDVGLLVDRGHEAERMVTQIEHSLRDLQLDAGLFSEPTVGRRVAYFIWQNPYMVAASDTFIQAMLDVAGFQNAFAHQTRYPVVMPDDIQKARPDCIFLSSEPYPFTEKHAAGFRAICPSAKVLMVDGELFSWYGSRLLRASDYFRNLQREITHYVHDH